MENTEFFKALEGLLKIPSVAVDGDAEFPFGENCAKALDYMLGICESFGFMGVKIDNEINDNAHSETILSTPDSSVKVALIPTNEELMIARDTMHIVAALED